MNLALEAATNEATYAQFIVGIPLLGAVLLLFFGKRLGKLSGIIGSATIGIAFVFGVLSFLDLTGIDTGHGENARVLTDSLFTWIEVGGFNVHMSLVIDQLSIVMVLVITGVGFPDPRLLDRIHVGRRELRSFLCLSQPVRGAMLLLVLGDNLLVMFVGWEGVGLCSYLLIGFWFEDRANATAAKKAFVVNRIGDFSFLLGIFLLTVSAGTLTFAGVNESAASGAIGGGMATVGALLLFGGATGKSAQIPLYVWLPDAMAGPTPVSALIHAATMVTAGVYMVARTFPLFEAASFDVLLLVAWVGGATAVIAAIIAAAEYDIKKVLAYSTISQLGYMFLALGVGAYSIAIFHLVTHAFFKALMFLGSGSVMHALDGETDMRKMGGLRKVMPITGWTFMMGWLAICGIIPFSGFFSKDAILAGAWADGQYALWGLGVATAGSHRLLHEPHVPQGVRGRHRDARGHPRPRRSADHGRRPDPVGDPLAPRRGPELPGRAHVRAFPRAGPRRARGRARPHRVAPRRGGDGRCRRRHRPGVDPVSQGRWASGEGSRREHVGTRGTCGSQQALRR